MTIRQLWKELAWGPLEIILWTVLCLLMGAAFLWSMENWPHKNPTQSPTYSPKYLAGQCIVLPVKPLTLLRIEMVDREAALYLVRSTPASIYREQIGMVVEAQTIDQFKPTLCPNQT